MLQLLGGGKQPREVNVYLWMHSKHIFSTPKDTLQKGIGEHQFSVLIKYPDAHYLQDESPSVRRQVLGAVWQVFPTK